MVYQCIDLMKLIQIKLNQTENQKKIFGCTLGLFCDVFHDDDNDDDEDDNNEEDNGDVRRAKFMRLADKLVSQMQPVQSNAVQSRE